MGTEVVIESLEAEQVSLFGAFCQSEFLKLKQYLTLREYPVGQKVFKQGDLPQEIYILHSGCVEFYVEQHGVTSLQGAYSAGQTFGESAFLGIQPHAGSVCVRGSEPAKVIVITRDALMSMQKQEQSLFSMLMMNLAREVSRKYHGALV